MKTLLSLTLFFALFLKMGGFYAILSFEREEIREKVEQKIIKSLPKSALICIVDNNKNRSNIKWKRPEKEFGFEGNLYDVVYSENIAGTNHYYCLSDEDETKLEAKIDKLLEKETDHLPFGNHSKLILDFLSQPLIFNQNPSFQFQYYIDKNTSICSNLTFFYLSDYISKLKRPPQFS